ncbi:methylated-DNA--[protein]-cysteine S-methyltransferase [Magnetospira thiophila]
MAHLSLHSPVGPLTLFEENGFLVALEWGRAPEADAASPVLDEAKRQLDAYFDGDLQVFDLPLLPQGTPFQQRVWAEMKLIPFGELRTYGDLARVTGSGPRAIGGACGRNPLPILIPCHRVTGANGALTGYSGGEGLETKRRLLALEGRILS